MGKEQDLATFRDRVKSALAARQMTQKALEEATELGAGALSRIFGGRKKLDAAALHAIASELGVSHEHLIADTALGAELDLEAPEITPEPDPARADPPPSVERVAPAPAAAAAAPAPAAAAPPPPEPIPEPEPEPIPEPTHRHRLGALPVIGAIVAGVVTAGAAIYRRLRRDR